MLTDWITSYDSVGITNCSCRCYCPFVDVRVGGVSTEPTDRFGEEGSVCFPGAVDDCYEAKRTSF